MHTIQFTIKHFRLAWQKCGTYPDSLFKKLPTTKYVFIPIQIKQQNLSQLVKKNSSHFQTTLSPCKAYIRQTAATRRAAPPLRASIAVQIKYIKIRCLHIHLHTNWTVPSGEDRGNCTGYWTSDSTIKIVDTYFA